MIIDFGKNVNNGMEKPWIFVQYAAVYSDYSESNQLKEYKK